MVDGRQVVDGLLLIVALSLAKGYLEQRNLPSETAEPPSATTMSTKTVTIAEAATHLAELLALVEQGDEVIIAKRKKPLAKLVGLPRLKNNKTKTPRVFGQHKGAVWVSDDFDTPLPDEFWLGSDRGDSYSILTSFCGWSMSRRSSPVKRSEPARIARTTSL